MPLQRTLAIKQRSEFSAKGCEGGAPELLCMCMAWGMCNTSKPGGLLAIARDVTKCVMQRGGVYGIGDWRTALPSIGPWFVGSTGRHRC